MGLYTMDGKDSKSPVVWCVKEAMYDLLRFVLERQAGGATFSLFAPFSKKFNCSWRKIWIPLIINLFPNNLMWIFKPIWCFAEWRNYNASISPTINLHDRACTVFFFYTLALTSWHPHVHWPQIQTQNTLSIVRAFLIEEQKIVKHVLRQRKAKA